MSNFQGFSTQCSFITQKGNEMYSGVNEFPTTGRLLHQLNSRIQENQDLLNEIVIFFDQESLLGKRKELRKLIQQSKGDNDCRIEEIEIIMEYQKQDFNQMLDRGKRVEKYERELWKIKFDPLEEENDMPSIMDGKTQQFPATGRLLKRLRIRQMENKDFLNEFFELLEEENYEENRSMLKELIKKAIQNIKLNAEDIEIIIGQQKNQFIEKQNLGVRLDRYQNKLWEIKFLHEGVTGSKPERKVRKENLSKKKQRKEKERVNQNKSEGRSASARNRNIPKFQIRK